jgi:hypothetical protein
LCFFHVMARPPTALLTAPKTWMAATRAAMTRCNGRPVLPRVFGRCSTAQPWA